MLEAGAWVSIWWHCLMNGWATHKSIHRLLYSADEAGFACWKTVYVACSCGKVFFQKKG